MRPNRLRRLLVLAGFGAILTGATLGTALAKADPLDTYTVTNAPAICILLDADGGATGVEDALNTLHNHGLDVQQASEVLVRAVAGWCPSHTPDVRAFIAKWSNTGLERA